jgi:hypothetical protein
MTNQKETVEKYLEFIKAGACTVEQALKMVWESGNLSK